MTRKTLTIISGHSDDPHPEQTAREAMFAAWDTLGKKGPGNRDALADLMIDCFVAPKLDYPRSASERFDLEDEADVRLRGLVMSAKAFVRELGKSDDIHTLPYLMNARLGADTHDQTADRLRAVEAAIRVIADCPRLPARAARARPRAVSDPYIRCMVRAVYWYVHRYDPGASPRLLAEHTIRALGHNPISLARHFEEILKHRDWGEPTFGWWDNYPDCLPRLAA